MSTVHGAYYCSEMDFPARIEPDWGKFVDRWYQLDAASYVLTETYWRHHAVLTDRPGVMFLASPGASNLTDSQFAHQASQTTPSPAKFVHTLPNVRSASLLKVMKWSGEVFCLQKDPVTVVSALSEAVYLARPEAASTWVVSVTPHGARFRGHIFVLGGENPASTLTFKIPAEIAGSLTDRDFFSWLNTSEQTPLNFVAEGLEIVKSPVR